MLKQNLTFKLNQKLSPQQIKLMKLIQLPTLDFEQRIKNEIEENPALETGIEEKANDVTTLDKLDVPDSVKEILGSISYIEDDFGSYEYNSGIEIESDWKLYLSFIGPAYEWAKGCTIFEIYQKYPEVYEGTFIRNILRLYKMVENIRGIATMCDQPQILKCLENIDSLLVRDQVTTESLYITK